MPRGVSAKKNLKRTYSKLTAHQLQLNLYQFFSIMFIFLALAISFISAIYYGETRRERKKTHTHTRNNRIHTAYEHSSENFNGKI